MIYTCTFSPAIDYTAYVDTFQSGALNRASTVHYLPGGKGINVSRLVSRFGLETAALGYIGGFTGQHLTMILQQEGIDTRFIETNETTRINVKIKSDVETELNGPAPAITAEQLQALLAQIEAMNAQDVFVLSGAVPKTVPSEQLLRAIAKSGATFVADTSGPLMHDVIAYRPLFIKPNIEELGQYFGVSITTEQQAIAYARKLITAGAQHVIVTLGRDGALFVSATKAWRALPIAGKAVNTVGAGDSVVAAVVSEYVRGATWQNAFRYGVAAGSATAFSVDLCTKHDVEALVPRVETELVEEEN